MASSRARIFFFTEAEVQHMSSFGLFIWGEPIKKSRFFAEIAGKAETREQKKALFWTGKKDLQ